MAQDAPSYDLTDPDEATTLDEITFGESDKIGEEDDATKRETSVLGGWRYLVLLVGLLTGANAAAMSFFFLYRENDEQFETSFQLAAMTAANGASFQIQSYLDATNAISDAVTVHASSQNLRWPFVTMPDFDFYAQQRRNESDIDAIYFSPLVSSDFLDLWPSYCLKDEVDIVGDIVESFIYRVDPFRDDVIQESAQSLGSRLAAPVWQVSPKSLESNNINLNFLGGPLYDSLTAVAKSRHPVMLPFLGAGNWYSSVWIPGTDSTLNSEAYVGTLHPRIATFSPVFSKLEDRSSEIVGLIVSIISLEKYLEKLHSPPGHVITCVVKNSCGQAFTYMLNGPSVQFVGVGDVHNRNFDDVELKVDFPMTLVAEAEVEDGYSNCFYSLHLYPSAEHETVHEYPTPFIVATIVMANFIVLGMAFYLYELYLRRTIQRITDSAERSHKIVSSLFPSTVRARVLGSGEFHEREQIRREFMPKRQTMVRFKSSLKLNVTAHRPILKDEYDGSKDEHDGVIYKDEPIADLFENTTIMFADIVGFTSWSATREPSQVFTLLETIYRAFDDIAKQRRVFKVETVGDCYVAVTGLPDPRPDHAILMARFAHECLNKLSELVKFLEPMLGPGTSKLSMRVGMHSGPVTAGVLRGERSRFQLFGDTMNTASRMEANGLPGRIQLSQATADLLIAANKEHWLCKRGNIVVAKGKGEMQTHWLEIGGDDGDDTDSSYGSVSSFACDEIVPCESSQCSDDQDSSAATANRLIQWNVENLRKILKRIVTKRRCAKMPPPTLGRRSQLSRSQFARGPMVGCVGVDPALEKSFCRRSGTSTLLDEVSDMISMPGSESVHTRRFIMSMEEPELSDEVETQLHKFVTNIAAMYQPHAFHNFEHASHAAMAVNKLFARIVPPSEIELELSRGRSTRALASTLHDHTYGIASDPLTHLACVLSALIHDIEHPGVSNAQYVKERPALAALHRGKSLAEQHAVELAWKLLMEDDYKELRATIYSSEDELRRFRQLIVNAVLATDIMDKELTKIRDARWEIAFHEEDMNASLIVALDNVSRKATLVIEHLVQAADLSHTMQNWTIYRKWNEALFQEMHTAFRSGRAEQHPGDNWYQAELDYFDNIVIPLATKLRDCGVFGISSDDCLDRAKRNRADWERKGRKIVKDLVHKYRD